MKTTSSFEAKAMIPEGHWHWYYWDIFRQNNIQKVANFNRDLVHLLIATADDSLFQWF